MKKLLIALLALSSCQQPNTKKTEQLIYLTHQANYWHCQSILCLQAMSRGGETKKYNDDYHTCLDSTFYYDDQIDSLYYK